MKIVFMGTMDFAVPILEGLIESQNVVMVVTQPDRPFGRKQILKPSAVKLKALEHGIQVFQPEQIKTDFNPVLELNPDLVIVAAYGQMIPQIILDTPKYKCINVHASLLPKYRGGAPMHKAIQFGEKTTGVTVMQMAMKMDSGPVYVQREIPISDSDDVGTLQAKLAYIGRDLLLETLPQIVEGKLLPIPQNETKITFAYNIKREEEHLNFNMPARSVVNHVRGYHPWPLTYSTLDGIILKVYEMKVVDDFKMKSNVPGEIIEVTKSSCYIQANPGIVSLEKIQLQGKTAMSIQAFLAGNNKFILSEGKILK